MKLLEVEGVFVELPDRLRDKTQGLPAGTQQASAVHERLRRAVFEAAVSTPDLWVVQARKG